jgi:hypothetical protein
MKLCELTGVKKLHDLSVSELIGHYIDATGAKYAGEGANSTVFLHPDKNEIIKFWIEDRAYDEFVKYALAHQGNPYIVKILSQPKQITLFHTRPEHVPADVMSDDDDGDIVTIDKQTPVKGKYIRLEKLNPVKRSSTWNGVVLGTMLGDLVSVVKDRFVKKQALAEQVQQAMAIINVKGDVTNVPEVEAFVATVFEMMRSFKDFNYDLHEGNIMLRGTTPVIIDPIASNADIMYNQALNYYSQKDVLPTIKTIKGPARRAA